MCGLLGIIGKNNGRKAEHALSKIQHRGPDNTSFISTEEFFLGHVRLSIIDLSDDANQPMQDNSGRYKLIFNGEIYNYKELKAELEEGYGFVTNSDTEVVIAGYIRWGEDLLNKLNGMYAIALWDNLEKKLFLARDKYGKKPLYYTEQNGSLIFASEIKGIIDYIGQTPEMNREAFMQYLSFLAPLPPNTIYKNVFKLAAGECAVYQNGELQKRRYYDIDASSATHPVDHDAIEELILDAVDKRLVSDVDVGSFLSGGIDSSLVSVMYKNIKKKNFHTFSIGYDEYKAYDELKYADMMAEKIGSYHHTKEVGRKEFLEAADSVFYHLDEPVNDPATIPTYILSGIVKENGIKVILTGEGSDECFMGYDFYNNFMRYYKLRSELSAEKAAELNESLLRNFNLRKNWEHIKRATESGTIFRSTGENFTDRQKDMLLNGSVPDGQSESFLKGYLGEMNYDIDKRMSYLDFKVWIAEVLLMKVDKMTMAHSVEARAPFLDYRLVDECFKIDTADRRGKTTKAILKKISEKYLPDEIINRRKKGFSSPYLEWFFAEYGDSLLDECLAVNAELGWFNEDFLKFIYNEGKNNRFRQHVWSLIVFTRWFNIYVK